MTRVQYRRISGCRDNRKVADSTIDIAISSNRYEPYSLTSCHCKLYIYSDFAISLDNNLSINFINLEGHGKSERG